jgi:hypothetical protein
VLAALVAGRAAEVVETADEQEVVAGVMAFIRKAYEPQGIQVPEPLQVRCQGAGQGRAGQGGVGWGG